MPRHSGPSVAEISADLAARIESLAEQLYPAGKRDGLEWRVGSVSGEPGDSLAIHIGDGSKRGTWKDFSSVDEGGDPLDLIKARFGYATTGEAVRWAKDWLGIVDTPGRGIADSRTPAAPPHTERPISPAGDQKKQAWAQDIWHKASPAAGTIVETYLHTRGITIAIPSALRFHRNLKHREANQWLPGMVAAVTAPDGRVMGVHRTYLTKDGRSKAFGKGDPYDSKMALGAISGGAIHLAPAGERLAICEGIETGLSVLQAWPGLPVWAALSAPGLTTIKLPDTVRSVLILADADPPDHRGRRPGQDAARRAAHRLSKLGIDVEIAIPPVEGKDWNDLLLDGTLGAQP